MSQENIELVRRGYEALRDSGEEAVFEFLHPDFDLTPVEEQLDGETFHGHDGLRRFFQMLREAFGDFGWEPQEFEDFGDHVLVATRFSAEGRGSGAPVEARIYNLWTIRRGKAVRVHGYLSRPEALEAAGLSEWSVPPEPGR
jgi:ketosteroid isomerase-like protein